MAPRERNTIKDLIAGSFGGVGSILVCHPLDTIRLRLQTDSSGYYRNATDCLRKTVRQEGFKTLYAGLAWPLLAQGLYKAVLFGTFSASSGFVQNHVPALHNGKSLTVTGTFLCGAAGGVANGFVLCPIELVRNRLMHQGTQKSIGSKSKTYWYSGPTDVARTVLRSEGGLFGMWRGIVPTLTRDFFGVGVYFVTFSRMRAAIVERYPQYDNSIQASLVAGACAGIGYWVVALPIDAVKSVAQTELVDKKAERVNGFARTIQIFRELKAQGGVSRLYRGFGISAARGVPGAAITFAVQQRTRDWLD